MTLAAAMTAPEAEVRVSEREVERAHTAAGPGSLDPPLPGSSFLNSSPLCGSERRSLRLETAQRLVWVPPRSAAQGRGSLAAGGAWPEGGVARRGVASAPPSLAAAASGLGRLLAGSGSGSG